MDTTNNVLFSIITPMYKGAALVGETIESVLAQTEPSWEMIVVDDCSPDGGEGIAVVKRYAKKDPRVKIIKSPENRGAAGARNLAMDNATGRFYAFLDSDDLWDANYLEKMRKHIEECKDKNAAIYFCGYRRMDNACKKELLPPYKSVGVKDYSRMLLNCPIFPSAAILDTAKLKHAVRFNERLRNLRDDYVFWLEIMKKQKLHAVGHEDILVRYRMRNDSLTASKTDMIYPQWNIYKNVLKLGYLRSAYYTIVWAVNGAMKYRRIRYSR